MRAELSGELAATRRFGMPKADVDLKNFLPNSPTWKCRGVTCARRQSPPQLVPHSHVPTGCPRGGRREAEPVPAPALMLQGGSSRMDGPIPKWVHGTALSSPSHLWKELLLWTILLKASVSSVFDVFLHVREQ